MRRRCPAWVFELWLRSLGWRLGVDRVDQRLHTDDRVGDVVSWKIQVGGKLAVGIGPSWFDVQRWWPYVGCAQVEDLDTSGVHPAIVLDQLLHELKVDQVVDTFVFPVGEALCAGVDLLGDLKAQR